MEYKPAVYNIGRDVVMSLCQSTNIKQKYVVKIIAFAMQCRTIHREIFIRVAP